MIFVFVLHFFYFFTGAHSISLLYASFSLVNCYFKYSIHMHKIIKIILK